MSIHDSDLVHIYDYADVYVSFDLTATNPTDPDAEDPFDVDVAWEPVGLLQEDSAFTHSRDEDTSEKFSWNGGFLRRTYKNSFMSVGFVPIEWNDTVRRIIDRGEFSDDELVNPNGPPERCKLALLSRDTTQDFTMIEVWDQAEVVLDGDVEHKQDEITSYEFKAYIFGDGVVGTRLFTGQTGS